VNLKRSDKSFLLLEAQDLRLSLTSTATALSTSYIWALHFLGERHKRHAFSSPTETNDTQNHSSEQKSMLLPCWFQLQCKLNTTATACQCFTIPASTESSFITTNQLSSFTCQGQWSHCNLIRGTPNGCLPGDTVACSINGCLLRVNFTLSFLRFHKFCGDMDLYLLQSCAQKHFTGYLYAVVRIPTSNLWVLTTESQSKSMLSQLTFPSVHPLKNKYGKAATITFFHVTFVLRNDLKSRI